MPELTAQVKLAKEEGREVKRVMEYCRQTMDVKVKEEELKIAAMKVAMKRLAVNTAAMQWPSSAECPSGASWASCPARPIPLLNEEGLPVVCETDIHGAITAIMVRRLPWTGPEGSLPTGPCAIRTMKRGTASFCGPWPISVAQKSR